MWRAILDVKTCYDCHEKHGKIYEIKETVIPPPPLHRFCRCQIVKLRAILAGNATKSGVMGADWWIKYYGKLPDYYISREEAKSLGWKPKKANLGQSAPGKMMFGGEYFNDNGKVPQKAGRKWYEADINYETGKRNKSRILFSNDGLIFVTYDHYETFYEIK
jgi:hypothetical protein